MSKTTKLYRFPRLMCGVIFIVFALISTNASAAEDKIPLITFEQIYANPDDQDLNLTYARQQADLGAYITAAAALERMLYAQPNWDSARLFYALVLYRLDDPQASLRELTILKDRPLSSAQKDLHMAYMEQILGAKDGSDQTPQTGK